MKNNITNCPRCGGDHAGLPIAPIDNLDLPYGYFTTCPTKGQPILIAVVNITDPIPVGVNLAATVRLIYEAPHLKEPIDTTVELDKDANSPTPSRYRWSFRGVTFDYYRLCEILGLTSDAQKHAFKKIIRAGRSVKSTTQDIDEAIDALRRWKEMIAEDSEEIAKAGF